MTIISRGELAGNPYQYYIDSHCKANLASKKWTHSPGRQIVSVIWLHIKHGFLNTGLTNSVVTIVPLSAYDFDFKVPSETKNK